MVASDELLGQVEQRLASHIGAASAAPRIAGGHRETVSGRAELASEQSRFAYSEELESKSAN